MTEVSKFSISEIFVVENYWLVTSKAELSVPVKTRPITGKLINGTWVADKPIKPTTPKTRLVTYYKYYTINSIGEINCISDAKLQRCIHDNNILELSENKNVIWINEYFDKSELERDSNISCLNSIICNHINDNSKYYDYVYELIGNHIKKAIEIVTENRHKILFFNKETNELKIMEFAIPVETVTLSSDCNTMLLSNREEFLIMDNPFK